jgi:hypothetical protein
MSIIKGVVHGKTIELDTQTGFPDGEPVTVFVRKTLPPSEGIRQSAGAWADGCENLDRWLEATQASQNFGRRETNS